MICLSVLHLVGAPAAVQIAVEPVCSGALTEVAGEPFMTLNQHCLARVGPPEGG